MVSRQCKVPICGNSATQGAYCDEHQKFKPEPWSKKRPRDPRYGTARWQKLVLTKKRNNPICEICNRAPTEEVHHIKPVQDYPDLFWAYDNLQSTCEDCHRIETRRETIERQRRRARESQEGREGE